MDKKNSKRVQQKTNSARNIAKSANFNKSADNDELLIYFMNYLLYSKLTMKEK